MVAASSSARSLADLKGRSLAVAGGPLDKSWLLLQGATRQDGIDIKAQARVNYGAPALLAEKALQGEFDATLNYWNFCAALEAKGMRRLASIADILPRLGAKGSVAMIGYVFDAAWAAKNRGAVDRFLDVTRRAKEILANSDAEWQRIAPLIGTADAATLRIYRDRYREGIPRRPIAEEEEDARALPRAGADRWRRTRWPSGRARSRHLRPATGAALMIRLASLALFVAVWWGAAHFAGERLLPDPLLVLDAIIAEARSGALLFHLGATLARVLMAFTLALALGTAIGVVMGRSRLADRLADPWILVLLNLPALVVIVLAYIWAGLTEAAAIAAVAVNKLPNTAVTVREGARALDQGLDEMSRVFQVPRWKAFRHVVLPQLAPYLAAAARSGLSLVWKIVLVVELLGRPNGVGFQIGIAFQLFDVTRILAYALSFTAVVLAIETFLVQPFERRVSRWRLRPA